MCGLSLAWVTSENSTSNSNADILSRSSSPWLDPFFSATVSGVRCWLPLSVVPRQLCLLSRLSAVQSPTNCQLLCPTNSLSCPLTTPGYGEISGPRILCLVSRQNRQRNRLLWRATHIVLQKVYDKTDSKGHIFQKRNTKNPGIRQWTRILWWRSLFIVGKNRV